MEKLITLNDWRFRSLVIFLSPLQLLVIILAIVPASFVPGSFLRQLFGLIYLTFIPGFLLMRILRIHNISGAKAITYSLGISISLVTFAGLLVNTALPLFGVARPISDLPITWGVSLLVIGLGAIAYIRDRQFEPTPSSTSPLVDLASPDFLLLLALPLVGAIGALLSIHQQNNILSLALIPVIAVLVGLIAFDRFVRPRAYGFAMFAINYAIFLYGGILASRYPIGFNMDDEYYSQVLLLKQGYWTASAHNMFSSLGSTLLGPIYSLVAGFDINQVRSGVYPFIFALLVLAIFAISLEQLVSAKKAFFSSFFVVAMVTLWQIQIPTTRYEVGMLLFGVLVLLVADRQLLAPQRSSLALIISLSLAISYYGTAYIGVAIFLLAWLVYTLMQTRAVRQRWQTGEDMVGSRNSSLLHFTWIGLCFILAYSWQMYTSPTFHFTQPYLALRNAFERMTDFFSPEARPEEIGMALGLGLQAVSLPVQISRAFHYAAEVFIVIGVLRSLFYPRGLTLRGDYIALSFSAIAFLGAVTLVPFLAFSWGAARCYFFALIVLAPVGIIGCETIWLGTMNAFQWLGLRRKRKTSGDICSAAVPTESGASYLRFVALLVLIPIMLLQSGVVYETLYAVAPEYAQQQRLVRFWHLVPQSMDTPVFNQGEVTAATWLARVTGYRTDVAGDKFAVVFLYFWFRDVGLYELTPQTEEIPQGTYIYFRSWNVKNNRFRVEFKRGFDDIRIEDMPILYDVMDSSARIYDSGEARIFLSR